MNLAYQVYSQVASQLQVARAKVQEENLFCSVRACCCATVSFRDGIKDICITIYVLAIVGTISWIFIGDDLWNRLKGIR